MKCRIKSRLYKIKLIMTNFDKNDFILKKFTRWQKTKRKEKQASNK